MLNGEEGTRYDAHDCEAGQEDVVVFCAFSQSCGELSKHTPSSVFGQSSFGQVDDLSILLGRRVIMCALVDDEYFAHLLSSS